MGKLFLGKNEALNFPHWQLFILVLNSVSETNVGAIMDSRKELDGIFSEKLIEYTFQKAANIADERAIKRENRWRAIFGIVLSILTLFGFVQFLNVENRLEIAITDKIVEENKELFSDLRVVNEEKIKDDVAVAASQLEGKAVELISDELESFQEALNLLRLFLEVETATEQNAQAGGFMDPEARRVISTVSELASQGGSEDGFLLTILAERAMDQYIRAGREDLALELFDACAVFCLQSERIDSLILFASLQESLGALGFEEDSREMRLIELSLNSQSKRTETANLHLFLSALWDFKINGHEGKSFKSFAQLKNSVIITTRDERVVAAIQFVNGNCQSGDPRSVIACEALDDFFKALNETR